MNGDYLIEIYLYKISGNECRVLWKKERCDFNYKMKDPEGQAPDISVTECLDSFEYPKEGSGDQIVPNEGRATNVFYCPLNSIFDEQKTWGICNGGCFEDDGDTS